MSVNKLKQELKKAKFINQILMGVGGVLLVGNIILGVTMFQKSNKTEVYTSDQDQTALDSSDLNNDLDENLAVYQSKQKIDSFQVVVDTLTRRLARANIRIQDYQSATLPSNDYVGELIQYAKQFTNTDCNKSLAFLYAAKKIASTDGTSEANKNALSQMINSCEDNLFGNNSEDNSSDNSVTAND